MKQIAACGVSDDVLELLEGSGAYQLTRFGDSSPESSGSVKLAYFLLNGPAPDLILIGYSGAKGLAACDNLYERSNAPPILWLCDREEFGSEAERMGVKFFLTSPPDKQDPTAILEVVRQALRGAPKQ